MYNNKLIILTGPSGVGKATIEKQLLKNKSLKLKLSVSATTRKPRKGEIHGKDYFFLSSKEFDEKIKNNEFLEWNTHFSNKYGTFKENVKEILSKGLNPILEVEVNGAKNIMNQFKENIISIFISPPSTKELMDRIKSRRSETETEIKIRMERIEKELSCIHMFDYEFVNHTVIGVVKEIENILEKKLLKK